ncbi:MAG: aromatic ring-hydroxylating dioxygenase subunit alpha [Myxococcota bacterium]|jgi:glycine betaine catabolism A|nr:aromatic ring-hydroxylating dioxygenase subunit alpha [Myxococcota bacterium]
MAEREKRIAGYNGLTQSEPTLPTHYYLDAAHHEKELARVWYRNWVYVCRADELEGPRAYRVFDIGTQQVLVVRDQEGKLQAFHNTCRHRGSQLVQNQEGRLPGGLITCPYHCWAYDLEGKLRRLSGGSPPPGFDKSEHALYGVGIQEWKGFVFVHLDHANSEPLESIFSDAGILDNWHLADLVVGHTLRKSIRCNWKIFWENFSECLHCPHIHRELSGTVPLYKQYLMEVEDDPEWEAHQSAGNPLFKPGLAEGKETWSTDGKACGEFFPDLTPEEIEVGHTYCEALPSFFVVGHVDYARTVRVLPLGPEETEIQAQWLFRPEVLSQPDFDAAGVVAFSEQVIAEDGAVAELNQRGLHSIRHKRGALMAEEYAVHDFHVWLRSQLD